MLGIFDSGLGGLTVAKALMSRNPSADFVYLGDTARAPYGDKSVATICEYARQDAELLWREGIHHIAIACNSVSAVALTDLKITFPDITFYDVVSPTVVAVVKKHPRRIGIIGTRATVASGIYEQEIKRHLGAAEIMSVACPMFVPWVEEGFVDYPETDLVMAHYLEDLKSFNPEVVVLACTHYPMLQGAIGKTLGDGVVLVSSSEELAQSLPESLFAHNSASQVFRFTDLSPHTVEIAHRWLGEGIEVELAKL